MKKIEQLAQELLPSGWKMREVKNLALRYKLGDERVTEDLASEGGTDGTIALIVSGDLDGTKNPPINKYVTLEALQEKARQVREKKKNGRKKDIELVYPKEGTVLLNVARRKAGTVGMLNAKEAVFNNAVYAITPDPAQLYADWLFYYFKNPRIKHIISTDFMPAGSTYANVTDIRELPVPIPPRDQQEQLLRRIDGLLTDVERAQALLKANQERIDHLLDSTLREIFSPSRLAGWHDEPLSKFVTIRDLPWPAADQSDSPYYYPFSADAINPVLARLTIDLTGTTHVLSDKQFSPLASNPDVIVYAKNYRKDNWSLRIAMPYRDIDKVQHQNIDIFKYSSDLHQLTVSATERIQPRFLFWSLLSPQLTRSIRGDTPPKGKLTILQDKILSSELFFPATDEQEQISTYLDSVQEKIVRMYANQVASVQAIEKMEESILNQAFAGKL